MSADYITLVEDVLSPLSSSQSLLMDKSHERLCFICDEVTNDENIQLQFGQTTHSKTGLPVKLGQLIGDDFMVIVSVDDRLCFTCIKLINLADKLEIKLNVVKRVITEQLKTKYQLSDDLNNSITDSDLINCTSDIKESETDYIIGNETTQPSVKNKNETNKTVSLKERVSDLISQSDSEIDIVQVIKEKSEYERLIKNSVKSSNDANMTSEFSYCSTPYANQEIKFEKKDGIKVTEIKMVHSNTDSSETDIINKENKIKSINIKKELVCSKPNSKYKLKASKGSLIKSMFKCTMCNEDFSTQVLLRKHIMNSHLTKWSCHFCTLTFSNGNDYQNHMKTHIKNVKVQFQSGVKISSGEKGNDVLLEGVSNSEKQNLGKTFFKCKNCKFKTKFNFLLDKHENECCLTDNNKNFKCCVCSSSFKSKKQLSDHICSKDNNVKNCQDDCSEENKKPLSYFQCGICSIKFSNKANLIQHLRSHKEKKLCLNNISDYSIKEESVTEVIEVDVDFNTNDNENETDKSELRNSDNKQDCSESSFSCEECSVAFEKQSSYNIHMNKHKNKLVNCSKKLINNNETTGAEIYFDNVEHFMALPSESAALNLQCDKEDNSLHLNIGDEVIYNDKKIDADLILMTRFTCNICNMAFSSKNDLDKHIALYDHKFNQSVSDVKYNIICSNKDTNVKNVISNDKVIKNKNDSTVESQFVNEIIINSFNSQHDEANIDSESVDKKLLCQLCPFIASSLNELKSHEIVDHSVIDNTVTCNICDKLINKCDENEHYNCHETIYCKYCSFETKSRKLMMQHIKEHNNKNTGRKEKKLDYLCQYCSETFKTKKLLKSHEEMHPENFEYPCNDCDKKFMKEKQLKNHFDDVHRDPHCCYCGKEIFNLKALKNHEQRHIRDFQNSNKLECDICKRVFKTRTGLRHHFAVHTGKFKYFCDFCQRGFMSRMMLEEHRSRHTKEDRYVCDVCGRKFTFQSTYWIHRKWHDNPFPYKCNFCGRLFRHTSLLAVHKRKHTGERPYKCPHCPLSFTVGGTLKRHLILHTQKYPFWCETCKRGFTTKHKYSVHLSKMHNNDELINDKNSKKQTEFKMVVKDKAIVSCDENEKLSATRDQPDSFEFMPDATNFTLVNMEEDDTGNSAVMMPCIMTTVNNEDNSGLVFEIISDSPLQQISNSITLQENTILPDMWCQ